MQCCKIWSINRTNTVSSPTSDSMSVTKGLNEDTVRLISTKKNEPQWLLEFRLKDYQQWLN